MEPIVADIAADVKPGTMLVETRESPHEKLEKCQHEAEAEVGQSEKGEAPTLSRTFPSK